jgi:hypothetical protein
MCVYQKIILLCRCLKCMVVSLISSILNFGKASTHLIFIYHILAYLAVNLKIKKIILKNKGIKLIKHDINS